MCSLLLSVKPRNKNQESIYIYSPPVQCSGRQFIFIWGRYNTERCLLWLPAWYVSLCKEPAAAAGNTTRTCMCRNEAKAIASPGGENGTRYLVLLCDVIDMSFRYLRKKALFRIVASIRLSVLRTARNIYIYHHQCKKEKQLHKEAMFPLSINKCTLPKCRQFFRLGNANSKMT